jgi:hypothetical protein
MFDFSDAYNDDAMKEESRCAGFDPANKHLKLSALLLSYSELPPSFALRQVNVSESAYNYSRS